MELCSDDSWEPEPCDPRDLCCEEEIKEYVTHASDAPQQARPESSRFSQRLMKKRVVPDVYKGTARIPIPDRTRADPVPINSGTAACKGPKRGMHGKQVGMGIEL